MDNIIVYLDDADYALEMLQPMLPEGNGRTALRWILVGCAPRVTHHASKWVTQRARQSWREKWGETAFSRLLPLLRQQGDTVLTELAGKCLREQTTSLIRTHGAARVLDARRPKFGQDLQAVTAAQPRTNHSVLGYAAAIAGAGLLLAAD